MSLLLEEAERRFEATYCGDKCCAQRSPADKNPKPKEPLGSFSAMREGNKEPLAEARLALAQREAEAQLRQIQAKARATVLASTLV